MTGCARIWNSELLCQPGRDESKRMTAHIVVAKRLRNLRHVASCALAPGAVGRVMCVFTHRPVESGWIAACVATEAKCIAGNDQV